MGRWQLVSILGESVFLLPCAVFLYAWLCWRGARAGAQHWLLAFSCSAFLVLASKLAFMGWGIGSEALDFTGFSGHAMMAASILPMMLYVAMPAGVPALGPVAAGLLLAFLVAASRLALNAHSFSEVVGGLLLGLLVSLPLIRRQVVPRSPAAMGLVAATLAIVLVLPAGGVVGITQRWIEDMAVFLSGRDRPFERGEWSYKARSPGGVVRAVRPVLETHRPVRG